jgi:hypothetical protein
MIYQCEQVAGIISAGANPTPTPSRSAFVVCGITTSDRRYARSWCSHASDQKILSI